MNPPVTGSIASSPVAGSAAARRLAGRTGNPRRKPAALGRSGARGRIRQTRQLVSLAAGARLLQPHFYRASVPIEALGASERCDGSALLRKGGRLITDERRAREE